MQRINPNPQLANSLKQATLLQQVALYAENGIWDDALNSLAEIYLTQPKKAALATEWTSLLKSVDLENLAHHSLLNCCKAN